MKYNRLTKNLSHLVCVFSLAFTSTIAFAQPTSQIFNTSGTYTVPAGYAAIATIETFGAGGGAGSNTSGAKGGGGGGAYASSTTTLNAGSYTVTVGTGGTAGVAGGNSSFTTIVIAEGGGSTTTGTGGGGGTTAGSTGTTKVAGAAGNNNTGNDGGAGGGGASGGGTGGTGGTGNTTNGTNGTQPGGGGGGKGGPGNTTTSGNGGDGRVVVTVNTVLSVRVGNIKAFEKQQGVQIEWITFGETSMDKYKIERSEDGIQFSQIGEVRSVNSSSEKKYSFLDVNPVQGLNFYQIKSVDFAGKTTISEIVRVNLDKTNKEITLYPNPVVNGVLLFQGANLPKGNYEFRILNATGQQLYIQRFNHTGGALTQAIQLPSASFKSGLYTLQVDNENTRVAAKSFMVQ